MGFDTRNCRMRPVVWEAHGTSESQRVDEKFGAFFNHMFFSISKPLSMHDKAKAALCTAAWPECEGTVETSRGDIRPFLHSDCERLMGTRGFRLPVFAPRLERTGGCCSPTLAHTASGTRVTLEAPVAAGFSPHGEASGELKARLVFL